MSVEPVFVFDDPPTLLVVYVSLDEARESLESLDVVKDQAAFTATGQVIDLSPVDDLLAGLELADRHDLARLKLLLRQARGPFHLADDPMAYAQEWRRVDDVEAGRSPLLPEFVSPWLDRKRP